MPVNNLGHLRISIQYFLELTVVLLVGRNFGEVVTPPCTGRQILNSSFGIISDGTNVYHPSSHCEWLIIGGPKKFVSLEFVSMSTECTYDYLFVYNGSSFNDELLGAFSGESDPGTLVAKEYMMIYFFSDRNYVRQGFLAKFYVSDCPMNCSNRGRCNRDSGVCQCEKEFTGDGCQYLLCSDTCEKGLASSDCTKSECRCQHGFLRCNASSTGWKMVSENGFARRAGLSGAYVRSLERLYLFGGFDLQRSLNDLFYYDFKSHAWGTVEQPVDGVWPSGRHGHTMGILGGRIILMFGGSKSDDDFSNELWMFDVHSEVWTLLEDPEKSLPPTTGHAMVVTSSGWLYLLGGMTVNGTFLSDLWRCDVSHLANHDGDSKISWEKLSPKGGLDVDRRLIGHSMVHDSKYDRLLVFGGITVDSARFPRRSPSLQVYQVGENWWADLSHFGRNSFAPRERAFHQATMVGDYMVVVGGNVHSHHEYEHCYDGNIFFLHLPCMTWIDGTKFETGGERRRIKGRYSHFMTSADDRMVLVAGGFRGSLLGSLEAYVFPDNMVPSTNRSEEGDLKCALHRSAELCTSDPNCLWCSVNSNNSCLHRISWEKCQRNGTLNYSFCPGICEFLKTCEACVALGKNNVHYMDDCVWCVLDSKCRKLSTNCSVEPNVSALKGWWKDTQTLLVDVPSCVSDNKPPGLLWLRYKNPANPKLLEEVELVRNSTQMFHFNTAMDKEYHQEFTYMARLVGFIHPPRTSFPIHLTIFGSTVQTWLYLSTNSSASQKVLVAESKMSTYFNIEAKRPNGQPLFGPNSSRYYVEMVVNQTTAPSSSQMSVEVGLRWNITSSPFRKNPVIGTEFLEPPNGGNCSALETCTSCLTDFSCGWCVDSCVARSSLAQSPVHRCYPGSRSTHYFVTNLTHCTSCSNHTTCHECLVDPSCEWSVMEARCFKRGQFNDSLVDGRTCPLPCHLRNNITWCLQDENECAWCEDVRRCFAFVEYIPRYPYGGCRMWLDSATDIVPLFDCTSIKNCSSCIRTHLCGWCYLTSNPSVGVCHRGDFLGPYDGITCDEAMSSSTFDRNETSADVHSWSYEECQDVDECNLDMHDCHENAVCINTIGSYNCSCKRGFTGDGVSDCERTCYEVCTNGRCSGPPHYTCECDLGWTGESCNIDCGCYFHSTCLSGTCDRCIHGTHGENCQFCMTGFFGNSTSVTGCSPCQCNGHADESKDICDGHDGACHCKDNTAGRNCQTCAEGYYGDPRDSGKCFKECDGRSMILGATEGGLGTANLKNDLGHLFCLWVLSVSDRLDNHQSTSEVITLTIHKDLNISCANDRLYIYDGIPDNFGFPSGPSSRLVAAVCGEELQRDLVFHILSGKLVVFFEFAQSAGHSAGSAYYGFNATYNISNVEPDYCSVTCADQDSVPSHLLQTTSPARPPTPIQTCIVDGCTPLHPNSLMGYSVVPYSAEGLKGAFVFGGKNFSTISDELWFIEYSSWQWKHIVPESSFRPSARYFHASECLPRESKIFIHGGILADDSISDELWIYGLDSKTWSLSEALGSPALAGHSLSVVGDNYLLVVGCLPFLGHCSVVHKFDPNMNRWSSLPEAVQLQGLYGHSAAYSRKEQVIYIHGGYQWEETSGFQRTNRIYALNLENKTFVASDGDLTYQPPPSSMHSSFALDDLVIVIGGDLGKPLFHSYFPSCNVWMELDRSGVELPEEFQYFGKFWSDGTAIFGTAASGSLRRVGLTRLDFKGDVYRLIGESKRCQGSESCHLCSVKTHKELCMANSTVDHQCFRIGRPKQVTKDCTASTSRPTCTNTARGCLWCSKCSKCISATEDCSRTCILSFLEGAQHGSNDTEVESSTPAACRTFLNCSDCLKEDKCAWRIPRCDAKGCPLGRCHPRSTNSSLGSKCPPPCRQHTSCSTCLNVDSTCLWSVTSSKCYSAYEIGLSCSFGECGTLLSWGKKHLCPKGCEGESSCSSCLRKPHCGWCSSRRAKPDPGGVGVCMEGGLNGPRFNDCRTDLFARDGAKTKEGSLVPTVSDVEWSFVTCPGEDECENGHHTCDNNSQFCTDKEVGFECQCKDGFNFNTELGRCQPHCKQGCLHGTCASPDVCECHFGYVGRNCSVECQCNKHSNCESELNKGKCLNCSNNTMGSTCELCRPLFVGNPKNGGKCEPCLKYCNEHSRICLSRADFNHTLNYPDLPTNEENIGQWLKEGSSDSKNTKCKSCANNTQGDRCEKCKPGHFRQPHLLPSTACQKCLCNGHSDYCDPEKGDGCDCRNNTKSPRCDSSDSSKLCFKVQCSQCVDNFLGTPTDGHQCYRQMSVESQHCFDPLTQMNCNPTRDPDPLLRNRTVFFAIQPKYLNVNIRIFIDVTRGGLNLYFAPFDNAFQVFVNPQDGIHRVVVDPAYKLYDPKTGVTINDAQGGEEYEDHYVTDHVDRDNDADDNNNDDDDDDENSRGDDDEDEQRGHEKPDSHPKKSTGARLKRGFTSISTRNKKFGTSQNKERLYPSTSTSPPQKSQMSFQNDKQPGSDKFFHLEKVRAKGLTTFITVDKPETFLFVENIVNRLVVILPNNVHPLKVARFYLVLLGVHYESYGSVYMRQDQPHIDLFVFFSVFFSCFFLFLAVCVLLWKAKQMNDARRSRHRSLLEMEHMASRPSAHVIVVVDGHSGIGDFYGKEMRTSISHQQGSFKALVGPNNAEGDKLTASTTSTTRATGVGRTQNKKIKNFVVHPIAVEYAHDNAVAVATFLFELPGANTARIRSCFGSCMILPGSNLQASTKV